MSSFCVASGRCLPTKRPPKRVTAHPGAPNVRHADHIHVLHDGRIVAHGAHLELLAAGGTCAELFALQATGYTAA
jgi:ABC-type transport system involved in cytochrome bd biosynthesis fused ATPase/permease subunit